MTHEVMSRAHPCFRCKQMHLPRTSDWNSRTTVLTRTSLVGLAHAAALSCPPPPRPRQGSHNFSLASAAADGNIDFSLEQGYSAIDEGYVLNG